jgi:hypothetical protein
MRLAYPTVGLKVTVAVTVTVLIMETTDFSGIQRYKGHEDSLHDH